MTSRPGRPVVVFDIGGTLLDSTGTVQDECQAVLAPSRGSSTAAEIADGPERDDEFDASIHSLEELIAFVAGGAS